MQTMSADQSTNYMNSAGTHQPVPAFYMHHGQDPRKAFKVSLLRHSPPPPFPIISLEYAMRNSNPYPQPMRMPQVRDELANLTVYTVICQIQYYPIPMSNGYMQPQQMYYTQQYLAPSPFVQTGGSRPMVMLASSCEPFVSRHVSHIAQPGDSRRAAVE